MTELLRLRLLHEQKAYHLIREHMSALFVNDPQGFVGEVGCRPEDLSSDQLRDAYRAMMVSGFKIKDNSVFARRFNSGSMFP